MILRNTRQPGPTTEPEPHRDHPQYQWDGHPNAIIEGDALEILRTIPPESFAVCVTSPPYNLGATNPPRPTGPLTASGRRRWSGRYADNFQDNLPREEYIHYHREALQAMLDALMPEGLIWYIHRRQPRTHPGETPTLAEEILRGFPVREEIVWWKGSPGPNYTHDGQGNAYTLRTSYETVHLLAKTMSAKLDGSIAAGGDLWHIERDPNPSEHPAAFPVALAYRCIKATLARGPVLDPFVGTGTTPLAARMDQRNFLGVDSSPMYATMARQRAHSFLL